MKRLHSLICLHHLQSPFPTSKIISFHLAIVLNCGFCKLRRQLIFSNYTSDLAGDNQHTVRWHIWNEEGRSRMHFSRRDPSLEHVEVAGALSCQPPQFGLSQNRLFIRRSPRRAPIRDYGYNVVYSLKGDKKILAVAFVVIFGIFMYLRRLVVRLFR